MALSEDLLQILVCPVCKGELEYDREKATLICRACKLCYRVEDDIPNFLVDEAQRLPG
jgi:uncharacterized protein YbaR (Trm112 family)